ncbi:MAG: hypothetical protein WC713_08255 [Candidatus Methylomirabilota bacterium]
MSTGTYLCVVPNEWTVADAEGEGIFAGPEVTRCPGYCAYIIACDREARRNVVFKDVRGHLVRIAVRREQFTLEGTCVPDLTPNKGPIFIGSPPTIRIQGVDVPEAPRTVVIGRERGEAVRWQVGFTPDTGEAIPLSPLLRDQAGGWYFLRFYGAAGQLLESMDFRYLRSLQAVEVPSVPLIPGAGGHGVCTIAIAHEPEARIEVQASRIADDRLTQSPTRWAVQVLGDPKEDEVPVVVRHGPTTAVPLTLRVPRIWWGDGPETQPPLRWLDHPIVLRRADLAATTPRALWFRFPTVRWATEVYIGFAEGERHPYHAAANKAEWCVPLRNFSGAACRQVIGTHHLLLRIKRDDNWHEGTIATLVVSVKCRRCGKIADSPEGLLQHLKTTHLEEYFRPLEYSEYVARFPELRLPPRIYQCCYCLKVVYDDDYSSQTSAIPDHIAKECPNVDHAKRNVPRMLPIYRLEDIRAIVKADLLAKLQDIYRCKMCGKEISSPDITERWHHLECHIQDEYSDELYSLE